MAGKKLGIDAKLYIKDGEVDTSTDIVGADPSGSTEWIDCTDITFSDNFTEIDATTRRMDGFKGYLPGLRDISLTVPVKKDAADAAYIIADAARVARTAVTIWILDGPVTSADSVGVTFVAKIFSSDEDQPLDDVVGASLTIKPTDSQYAPAAITNTI